MITMTGRAIRRWWPLFVLPTCFAFALGFVVPLVMGIYLSFTEFTTITDAEFVGLKKLCQSIPGSRLPACAAVHSGLHHRHHHIDQCRRILRRLYVHEGDARCETVPFGVLYA